MRLFGRRRSASARSYARRSHHVDHTGDEAEQNKHDETERRCRQQTVEPPANRRPDDNAETMRSRLFAYYKETLRLAGYYYAKGLLRSVDAMQGIEEVGGAIDKLLDESAIKRH